MIVTNEKIKTPSKYDRPRACPSGKGRIPLKRGQKKKKKRRLNLWDGVSKQTRIRVSREHS